MPDQSEYDVRSARRERWAIAPTAAKGELQAMEQIAMDKLRNISPLSVENTQISRIANNASILGRLIAERQQPATQPLMAHASVVAALLSQRGLDKDKADAFLNPPDFKQFKEEQLPKLLELKDMKPAIKRLAKAIIEGEKIGLSGDYDCDGNCSVALMRKTLLALGVEENNIVVHVPNRAIEGYGINRDAVRELRKEKVSLLITLDNGTLAKKPIEEALKPGKSHMDVIVIDHHPNSPDDKLPEGALVVNPNRSDKKPPDKALKDLAAVGVTFLLAAGLKDHFKQAEDPRAKDLKLRKLLGLVALATVGDVVNLYTPINRFFVHEGLKVINEGGDPAIESLCTAIGLTFPIDEEKLAYKVTPVINAPGRLGQSVAWKFLSSDEHNGLDRQDLLLSNSSNEERKDREAELTKLARTQAIAQIGDEYYFEDARIQANNWLATEPSAPVLVLSQEDWPSHLLEKIAQRMKEEFGRPVLACCAVKEGKYAPVGKPTHYQMAASSLDSVDIKMAMSEVVQGDEASPFHEFTAIGNSAKAIVQANQIDPIRTRLNDILEIPVRVARAKRLSAGIKDAALPPLEPPVLVLSGEHWNEGVIGIVAGRIKELFRRPAVVCTLLDGTDTGQPEEKEAPRYKASARSIEGVDLGTAFRTLAEGKHKAFLKAGGHPMAAGAMFEPDKLDDVRTRLTALLKDDVYKAMANRSTQVAGVLPLESIDAELIRHMSVVGPFGQGNRKPLVVIPDVRIRNIEKNGKHVHFELVPYKSDGFKFLKASAFHLAGTEVERELRKGETQCAQVLGTLGFDHKGNPSLVVEDVYISPHQHRLDFAGTKEILGANALSQGAFTALAQAQRQV